MDDELIYSEDLLRLAKSGDEFSLIQLAIVFALGLGVEKDEVEAASWLRLAAKKGNPVAQYHLANAHEKGAGVVKLPVVAEALYRKAALKGHGEAQYSLGIIYYYGRIGIPEDDVTSYAWFRVASATVPYSEVYLRKIKPRLSLGDLAKAESLVGTLRRRIAKGIKSSR